VHGQEHQSIPCILLECHGSRHGGESVLLGPWIPLVLERIPCSPTTALASKQLHHIHIISAYHGRDRFLLAAQEKLKK